MTVAVAGPPDRSRPRDPQERAVRRERDTARRRAGRARRDGRRGDRRAEAFATMDGLLLSGGADLHPERYGQPSRGSLTWSRIATRSKHEAWIAAQARGLPVLGLCRGFQAINAFSGGTLLQHVDGHQGPRWGSGAGEDPSASDRARHATRPDPLPDQRRRRGPAASTRTTTRPSGRPTWPRDSSPTPGRAARPAT